METKRGLERQGIDKRWEESVREGARRRVKRGIETWWQRVKRKREEEKRSGRNRREKRKEREIGRGQNAKRGDTGNDKHIVTILRLLNLVISILMW